MEGNSYSLRTGMKVLCWITGVLCVLLVILSPLGFLMIWMALGLVIYVAYGRTHSKLRRPAA